MTPHTPILTASGYSLFCPPLRHAAAFAAASLIRLRRLSV